MIEEREFDLQWEGRRCVVQQIGSKAARSVARRLLNTIGAALHEIGQAGGEVNFDLVAAGAVMERLSDETLDWLTDTFARVTRVEREAGSEEWLKPSDVSELAFGGGQGLERWRRWLFFCVEMSCGDFFAGALAEAGRRQAQAKANLSPTTSPRPTSFTASQRAASTTTA
jgi:hypothetical protein